MTFEESALLQRRYEAGLNSYTYLTSEHQAAPLSPPQPAAGATEASAPVIDGPRH